MKHLLTGVAAVAAIAFAAPVGAQLNPSAGHMMGQPGPNPGGAGPTSRSAGQTAAPPPAAATAPPSASDTSSAMPPKHRHPRHAVSHRKTAPHRQGKAAQSNDSSANQLNQEELARVQAGNFENPAAPAAPGMAPSPE
ncbi:MAG: hypothetical protein J2P48_07990 [Alphaproteobacteria bacterium]|nr:hypothetical protein [Alphaproteobacteria bacterium]